MHRAHISALPVLFIICTTLLLAAGCAARKPLRPTAPPIPLTSGAKLTFDYLYYLDQRGLLQGITQADPKPGSEEYDLAIQVQSHAARALEGVLKNRPSAMLYGEKASLFFNRTQIGTAKDILRKGLSLYPDDKVLLSLMVNAHLVEQDRDMAALTLEEYILKNPEDLDARIRLISILVEAEKFAKALDQVEQIDKKDQGQPVLYLKARSQSRIGNRTEAIKTIKKILKQNPEHYEALSELAYIHEVTAQFDKAVDVYKKLLDLGGPESEIRQRIITLSLKLNRVDEALKVALEGPETKNFLLQAAGIFLNQDFPAQASAVLDRLGGLSPAPPEYYFYKAIIAFDAEEDPEKALGFLTHIQPEATNHAQSLVFRVQVLMELDRKTEAMSELDAARKAYPNDLRLDRMLAEYFILEEKNEQAAAILSQAMAKHGDNPDLLFQYGALLDIMGNRTEAIATMERIIANDPENADALNYVGYTLADEGRDLERAKVLVENAMKQKPGNGAITDSLAWVLYKQGEYAAAWKQIQIAVDLHGDDAVLWEHYGDIAAALKKNKAAAKAWNKALTMKPKDPAAIRAKLEKLGKL